MNKNDKIRMEIYVDLKTFYSKVFENICSHMAHREPWPDFRLIHVLQN